MPAPLAQASARLAESEPNLGTAISSATILENRTIESRETLREGLVKGLGFFNINNGLSSSAASSSKTKPAPTTPAIVGKGLQSNFQVPGTSFSFSTKQNLARLRQRLQIAAHKALGSGITRSLNFPSLSLSSVEKQNSTRDKSVDYGIGPNLAAQEADSEATVVEMIIPCDKDISMSPQGCAGVIEPKNVNSTCFQAWANGTDAIQEKICAKASETQVVLVPGRRAIRKKAAMITRGKSDTNVTEYSEAMDIEYEASRRRKGASFEEIDSTAESLVFPSQSALAKPILVLDLDETLVHSTLMPRRTSDFWIEVVQNNDARTREFFWVFKRPGVDQFLEDVCEHYSVWVFTAGIREYASQILDRLDPTGSIFDGRLYRDECTENKNQGTYAKDLTKICTDLSRVILVDNTPACFSLQPANGLPIKSWYSDLCDKQLAKLSKFLIDAANVPDLRDVLNEWSMY